MSYAHLLCAMMLGQVASASPPADPAPSSVMERIRSAVYRFLFPYGNYTGDPAKLAQQLTDKGGGVSEMSAGTVRSYLVNVQDGALTEWVNARGAHDLVFCDSAGPADPALLLYRRGSELWQEGLRFADANVTTTGPKRVIGVKVSRLHACGRNGGHVVLFVEDNTRHLRWLYPAASPKEAWRWSELPPEFKHEPPDVVVSTLRLLRLVRPSGQAAFVANGRLVGQQTGRGRTLLTEARKDFWGYPLWLGDRDLLLVEGPGDAE